MIKKPKFRNYLFVSMLVGALFTVEVMWLMGDQLKVPAWQAIIQTWVVITAFATLYAWLMYDKNKYWYHREQFEKQNNFTLTYLSDGVETVSPVYPVRINASVNKDNKVEGRITFTFYDKLNKKGYPQEFYVPIQDIIKLENPK